MDDDKLREYVFTDLGCCGCGNPEAAIEFLRDVLQLIRGRGEAVSRKNDDYTNLTAQIDEKLGGDTNSPLYWWFWYLLDDKGLIEHGTSVRGSWLTEKGEELLGALKANDIAELLA